MTTPLRRHENWCNCNIFSGHSFGSAVAYVYASLFPDDVEAYVSIDCVRTLMMMQEDELLERIRYAFDSILATEKRLAFDPPSYTYEELRDLLYIGNKKSMSPESCDILLERGAKKLPADDR
jgi:pimeloyl-ACP methyl ester carboxylesterase